MCVQAYVCKSHRNTELFPTDPPYNDYRKFTGIPPSAVLGEPYDMECPYESNPPALYEWTRVPSCGSVEPLSWPPNTILYNDNRTLRLDGVLPLHYGYYNCSATNAFGSEWFCLWRKIDGMWQFVLIILVIKDLYKFMFISFPTYITM